MDVQPIHGTTCPECGADVSAAVAEACKAQEYGFREVLRTEVLEQVPDAWVTCPEGHQNKYECGLEAAGANG